MKLAKFTKNPVPKPRRTYDVQWSVVAGKILKLQKKLRVKKLDALLVTNPVNIRYLTGFVGVVPTEREAYVVLTEKNVYLLTSALYLQTARECRMQNVEYKIVEINYENKLPKRLAEIAKNEGLRRIGFEKRDLTVAEYEKILKPYAPQGKQVLNGGLKPVATENLVEQLRIVKDASEIAKIRKAANLTDEAFGFTLKLLKKLKSKKQTITEKQIAWEIEKYIKERGAQLAFAPIVAFGKNSAIPHHNTSSQLLTFKGYTLQGMLILIDLGASVDGYCADMTRMIFINKPTDEQKRVYEVILKAQEATLNMLRTERSGAILDERTRAYLEKNGLTPYPHSLGHGTGLEIHEGFRLTYKKNFTLKAGMVFSIEPATYLQRKFGIRIEDLVLLTSDGIEILSQTTKEAICL